MAAKIQGLVFQMSSDMRLSFFVLIRFFAGASF